MFILANKKRLSIEAFDNVRGKWQISDFRCSVYQHLFTKTNGVSSPMESKTNMNPLSDYSIGSTNQLKHSYHQQVLASFPKSTEIWTKNGRISAVFCPNFVKPPRLMFYGSIRTCRGGLIKIRCSIVAFFIIST